MTNLRALNKSDPRVAKLYKEALAKPKGTLSKEALPTGNRYEQSLYLIVSDVYGRWDDGGHTLQELICTTARNYRLDVALPRYQIGIELNGYKDHGLRYENFKRDHHKTLLLTGLGWHIITVDATILMKDPALLLTAIESIVKGRKPQNATVSRKGSYYLYEGVQ